ncbi:MAG: cell division protein ZapA [Myxococcota bacterium]
MDGVKQAVTIEIAGARYRLTTDADREHLQKLAEAVNARIEELGPKARRAASPAQLLAVAALSLAEDLQESERRRETLRDRTEAVIRDVIGGIDARLASIARDD